MVKNKVNQTSPDSSFFLMSLFYVDNLACALTSGGNDWWM